MPRTHSWPRWPGATTVSQSRFCTAGSLEHPTNPSRRIKSYIRGINQICAGSPCLNPTASWSWLPITFRRNVYPKQNLNLRGKINRLITLINTFRWSKACHLYLQQPQLQCLQIHRHVGSNVQTHPCKLRLPTYSDTLRYQESFTVIQSHSIILCQASSAQHSGKGLKKHFQNCCRICWGISKET